MLGGYNGSTTSMECTVEAYPTAVNYWERHDGKLIQERPGKYGLRLKEYPSLQAHVLIGAYCQPAPEDPPPEAPVAPEGGTCGSGETLLPAPENPPPEAPVSKAEG